MLSEGDVVQGLYIVRAMRATRVCQTYEVRAADGGPAVLKVFAPEAFDEVRASELLGGVSRLAKRRPARVALPRALGVWPVGADDRLCLLRDMASGQTLAERIASRPVWSPAEVLALARTILGILVGLGRDATAALSIKPENIVGGAAQEILTDVGVYLPDPEISHALEYRAPEQLEGKTGDSASDQYALGVVLFRLLTGCLPYEGATTSALLTAIRAGHKPPLSGELAPIIGRLLAAEPARRFQDVTQVLARLPVAPSVGAARDLASVIPSAPAVPGGKDASGAQPLPLLVPPVEAAAPHPGRGGGGGASGGRGPTSSAVDWQRIQKLVKVKKRDRPEIPYASGDAGSSSSGATADSLPVRDPDPPNDRSGQAPSSSAVSLPDRGAGSRVAGTGATGKSPEPAKKFRTLSRDDPDEDAKSDRDTGDDSGADGTSGAAARRPQGRGASKAAGQRRPLPAWLVPAGIAIGAIGLVLMAYLKLFVPGGGRSHAHTPHTERSAESAAPAPDEVPSAAIGVDDVVTLSGGEATVTLPTGEERKVTLAGGTIDRTEVTNAMFEAFVNSTGYRAQGNWRKYDAADRRTHPVRQVTWNDAVAYAKWVRKRLPTNDEWEAAARGADGGQYPWGGEFDSAKVQGGSGQRDTAPVGSFAAGASPAGALDMCGNVWEWTSDRDGANAILRGGSYRSSAEELAIPAARLSFPIGQSDEDIGFRCFKPLR